MTQDVFSALILVGSRNVFKLKLIDGCRSENSNDNGMGLEHLKNLLDYKALLIHLKFDRHQ